MTTYVLVHGGWHGGWCWRKVATLLRAKGHEVFTPTMTGLGDRVHLAGPEVGLETHVQGIINVLFFEDLSDVVLVGHSYGGVVVTGVADRVPERIKRLVYLDAFIPADGQSVVDILAGAGIVGPNFNAAYVPVLPGNFGVTEPGDVAWLESHYTAHPGKTLVDKLQLTKPAGAHPFSHTYIWDAGNAGPIASSVFQQTAERLRMDPAWRVHDLPTGHDVMVTMPNELTDILLAIA